VAHISKTADDLQPTIYIYIYIYIYTYIYTYTYIHTHTELLRNTAYTFFC